MTVGGESESLFKITPLIQRRIQSPVKYLSRIFAKIINELYPLIYFSHLT